MKIQANINGIMKSHPKKTYLLLCLSPNDMSKIIAYQKRTKKNAVQLFI